MTPPPTHPATPGSSLAPAAAPALASSSDAVDAARFQFFAVLFALATVLYHRWSWFPLSIKALPLVAAALVVVKPSASWRFAALLALQTAYAYRDLPGANTNRTLMVFLGATMLCAWPVAWFRAKRRPSKVEWFRCFEPALRLELLIVYAWAAWHKLNVDWFDIYKSCGVDLYLRVTSRAPFLPWPSGPTALSCVVVGTVLLEGLLPFLLFARPTRWLGLALAFALHFGFGLTMFFDFSMLMMSLLFLFAPAELARALIDSPRLSLRARLGLTTRQWSWAVPLTALVFVLVTRKVFWDMYDAFALAWWSLPPLLAIVAWTIARGRWTWPSGPRLLAMPAPMASFPLAVLLNGVCPYVGSKTETAFAMYSNLRTEGGRTNHLLIAWPLELFDYQTDLATIESSSDPQLAALAEKTYPVPFYVLRKRVAELREAGAKDVAIAFERGGVRTVVAAAERDLGLFEAPSYFERKFLRFRDILPLDANTCSH